MEESLKFNSQICTTKEQSQHLLDLGLKPETADMVYEYEDTYPYNCNLCILEDDYISSNIITEDIPAWSLHRLIELAEVSVEVSGIWVRISNTYRYEEKDNTYDNLIDAIADLINYDVFNKEYLKQ